MANTHEIVTTFEIRAVVTVWNEGRHEKSSDELPEIHPDSIHGALAEMFNQHDRDIRTAMKRRSLWPLPTGDASNCRDTAYVKAPTSWHEPTSAARFSGPAGR